MTSRSRNKRKIVAVVTLLYVIGTIVARKRGYPMGGDVIVRCRKGHLFTTIWVPGISFKSLRLGWWRFQYCPIGRHWTLVVPVRDADLDAADRSRAHEHRDARIP
jgi:hypothetical protein